MAWPEDQMTTKAQVRLAPIDTPTVIAQEAGKSPIPASLNNDPSLHFLKFSLYSNVMLALEFLFLSVVV